MQPKKRVFFGSFVHSLSKRRIEYLTDTLLAVDEDGLISFVQSSVSPDEIQPLLHAQGWQDAEVVVLRKGEFIIPG